MLYAGEALVIHFVGTGNATDDFAGYTSPAQPSAGSGPVDHIALTYAPEDYDKICTAIKVLGFARKSQTLSELGLRQLFIKDPDAMLVELNFLAA